MQWAMIPRFDRAVCDYFTLRAPPFQSPASPAAALAP
jgi:hypothetical protein